MNIESLEINLLKVSEIQDGDIIIIKMNEDEKSKLTKDQIQNLYTKLTTLLKKELPIFFFPSNLDVEIIKKTVLNKHLIEQKEANNV